MKDRAGQGRDSEMYAGLPAVATSDGIVRRRLLHAVEGAVTGVALWVVLLVLGVPWVFHMDGFDGLLPCVVLGILFGLAGLRRVYAGALAIVCLVLVIVAYTPIITGQVGSMIRNDPLPARADAVMVLAAGVNDDGTLSPTAIDRLLKGMELVNRGVAPVLVLSREAYIINGKYISPRQDQERIVSLAPGGLSKLVVAGITHSTHDEALRARDLARARNWKRIVVVTSPLHTRRACATFEKAGVVITCVASNTRAFALGSLSSPMDRVRAFEVWLYELAGTLRYWQLGWV